ncbi:MAG: hypothetical protein ABR908_16565 [Terriglobales bacterium]
MIAILPDKIVSVSLAAVLIYYLFPKIETRLQKVSWKSDWRPLPGPVVAFVTVYGASFLLLLRKGNVSIDPNTCSITGRSFIPIQLCVWAVPLLWGLISFALCRRPVPASAEPQLNILPRRGYVKAVYSDVLTILAGVFALLIAAKGANGQSQTAAAKIGALLENGLGMVAFFAIFGFTPGFLMRMLGADPDLPVEHPSPQPSPAADIRSSSG